MASDDASVPPDPADQDHAVRRCEKCDSAMKQLAELPALSVRAAIKVFTATSATMWSRTALKAPSGDLLVGAAQPAHGEFDVAAR